MSSTYDAAAADEWIQKVNLVQQTIRDLGKNDPKALKKADDLINKFERSKQRKNKPETTKKVNKSHRKGDGWKNKYKLYCNKCFTEILINTKQCPQCHYTHLITRTERRNVLQARVDVLKQEYTAKELRRKRWENYRKLHPKNTHNLTDYSEWELWEDDTDWSDYMNDGYIPDSDPAFKAMASDMQQRSEKRHSQMRAAIKEKSLGNQYLKAKNFSEAIMHYTIAIDYRRDYKALYTNRALAYMKLGRYDKCVDDCTLVIDMIEHIDAHQRKSDIIFKAYLRRANAWQLLGKLKESKSDISQARQLRPTQKDAIALQKTIDILAKDECMREQIQKQILNDQSLSNFDAALKLTLDYFRMCAESEDNTTKGIFEDKTPWDKRVSKWNCEKPSLLFGKLLKFVSIKHEYAVRFADRNGLYLGFTYLKCELSMLQNEIKCAPKVLTDQQKVHLNMKQMALSKLCKLLIYITSYKHNRVRVSRNATLIECIAYCLYYILRSFDAYSDVLSIESIHLCSVACEIKPIRDYIGNNQSYSKLFYENVNEYLLYSPPNLNKLQILQYLFDFCENLFGNEQFIKVSILAFDANDLQCNPHIYVALFDYLAKYCDYVHSARMGQSEMLKFEIKQSVVSSILSALATLFGPNESVVRDILLLDANLSERISILVTHLVHLNRMFIQFEEKNPLKNINHFGPGTKCNVSISAQQSEQVLRKLYEKHQLNISQIAKVITVFMSLSHHPCLHDTLLKLEIHQILFDLLPYVRYIDYATVQYANILSLARDHIINYFDQISNNKRFDRIIDTYNRQCGLTSPALSHLFGPEKHAQNIKKNSSAKNAAQNLPAFWTFITDIINRRSFITAAAAKEEKVSTKKAVSTTAKKAKKAHYKHNKHRKRKGRNHNGSHKMAKKVQKQQRESVKREKREMKLMRHLNDRRDSDHKTNYNITYDLTDESKVKEEESAHANYDSMEVDAQSGCIRILTRWIRRRLPDDGGNKTKKVKTAQNGNGGSDEIDIVADEYSKNNHRNAGNYSNRGSEEDNRVIAVLLQRQYNNIFKYVKHCRDPHVLANAPLLLKQFIIFAKLNEKNKPYLKKLIKKHSAQKLHDLMALFSNKHVSIIQNSVTCMAQLATLDEDLRDQIREMGGLKAMSQLHMQHRQSLFK